MDRIVSGLDWKAGDLLVQVGRELSTWAACTSRQLLSRRFEFCSATSKSDETSQETATLPFDFVSHFFPGPFNSKPQRMKLDQALDTDRLIGQAENIDPTTPIALPRRERFVDKRVSGGSTPSPVTGPNSRCPSRLPPSTKSRPK
jgi:hypothetical protein